MATLPNLVLVPCLFGPGAAAVNIVNSGSLFRAPYAQPQPPSTTVASDPVGPQRWPTKL